VVVVSSSSSDGGGSGGDWQRCRHSEAIEYMALES